MRRFLPSPNPEWNLWVDSNITDGVYEIEFLLTNTNPYLVEEELFIRLVLEKCRRASPSLISDVIRNLETVVSSCSIMYSEAYTDSDSIE